MYSFSRYRIEISNYTARIGNADLWAVSSGTTTICADSYILILLKYEHVRGRVKCCFGSEVVRRIILGRQDWSTTLITGLLVKR
jgi:hypothetical protein